MGTYPRRTKRATKKKTLSRKEKEALLAKKRRAAAKKGWKTRRENAIKRKKTPKTVASKKVPKKAASKKTASKKTPKKKTVSRRASQKSAARVRAKKSARVAKKVAAVEKRRERSRRKSLTPKKRRRETKAVREERKRIEEARLRDEKLRQIREEAQRQEASKKAVLNTLKERFDNLLEEAKRQKVIQEKPRRGKFESDRLTGKREVVYIGEILTEEAVEEVLYEVKQAAKKLPLIPGFGWLAVINFASLGESLLGYGQVMLSSSLPGATLFQAQGIESSGTMNTREGMLIKLNEKLEVLAGEKTNTVWINFIVVQTHGSKR